MAGGRRAGSGGQRAGAAGSRPGNRARRRAILAAPLAAILYLVLAWGLFLAVDVANAGGLRDALQARADVPHLWVHLFQQGGPTEMLQWILLGVVTVVGAVLAGSLLTAGRRGPGMFWLLFAVGAALMVIEDAGDPRHRLAEYGQLILGVPRIATEIVVFALIAAAPAYAVLRYARHPWQVPTCRRFLVAGIAVYAVVVVATATRDVGFWFGRAGGYLQYVVFGDRLLPFRFLETNADYWLMDMLVQESVELVAAALLCAATVAYLVRAAPLGSPGAGPTPDDPAAGTRVRQVQGS